MSALVRPVHHPITWGKEYWTTGLLAAAVYFLAGEITALFTNVANTLSDYSRYELGIPSVQVPGASVHYTLAWSLSLVAWWLFVGVITWHIWFQVNHW